MARKTEATEAQHGRKPYQKEKPFVVLQYLLNRNIDFSKNNQNKKYIKVTCSNIFISCAS